MLLTKHLTVVALALMLAACGTSRPASVTEGECKLVSAPEYAVLGKTKYDQEWIDDTTERLVGGCLQARPKARPEEWDDTPVKTVPLPPKKPSLWQRFRRSA